MVVVGFFVGAAPPASRLLDQMYFSYLRKGAQPLPVVYRNSSATTSRTFAEFTGSSCRVKLRSQNVLSVLEYSTWGDSRYSEDKCNGKHCEDLTYFELRVCEDVIKVELVEYKLRCYQKKFGSSSTHGGMGIMGRVKKRLARQYAPQICIILLCGGLLPLSLQAQGQVAIGQQVSGSGRNELASKSKKLESLLKETRAKHGLPALWAAKVTLGEGDVSKNLVIAASGVRRAKTTMQVGTNDLIHLGSCTKAMTATLIAQLVSSGKLDWDSKLVEIFPEVRQLQSSSWGNVTVRQLLEHRSGAAKDLDWFGIQRKYPRSVVAGRRAVLLWLLTQQRPAENEYLYSNIGYALLGHIVEQIEGRSWEQVIQAKLFRPLGMRSVGFGPVIGARPLSQPWGHLAQSSNGVAGKSNKAGWEPNRTDNAVPLGPAGRCHMAMRDWAKFVAVFASANPPIDKLGINEEAWQELTKTKVETGMRYAGGWILADREWGGGEVLNHAGSNTAWYCVAWVAPKREFFVLVATNCFGTDPPKACDSVAAELLTSKEY